MKKGKAVPPGSFQFLALNFNIGFIFLDSGMRLRILWPIKTNKCCLLTLTLTIRYDWGKLKMIRTHVCCSNCRFWTDRKRRQVTSRVWRGWRNLKCPSARGQAFEGYRSARKQYLNKWGQRRGIFEIVTKSDNIYGRLTNGDRICFKWLTGSPAKAKEPCPRESPEKKQVP